MLGEAAMPHPGRVLHALHAQAPWPCLAAVLAWPLPASHGPPSYHACAADGLPGRIAPTVVRPCDRQVPTFIWPCRSRPYWQDRRFEELGLQSAAVDWEIEGPRRHTDAWPVGQAG